MARGLKDLGLKELASLKKRVLRQHTLGRIDRGDKDNLIAKIDEIEAYIIKMPERTRRPLDFPL